ncbi:MAG: TrmH family RNA methyltransferase [Desulfovibrio piger]|uniref:TrmH family RNA methyltransferase n=3 Tax=Desulfovibrio TaxID=872 RepID=UPI00399346C0
MNQTSETPLLPGMKPVLELLRTDPQRIDLVFCKKGLRTRDAQDVQQLCRQSGVRFSLVDQAALDRLCREAAQQNGNDAAPLNHQGVVARLTATDFRDLADVLQAAAEAPLPLVVALDQVQDPGNVGTLCRTLYALGGAGVILPRHNSAYLGPAAHRAAAGALERLPVARVTNLAHALDEAEEAGFSIYGAGCGPDASDAFEHAMLYALGGAGVILPRHNSAYLGPAAHRAAAGALERLPVARVTNLAHALDEAEEAGFSIYGAGCGPDASDAFEHAMQLPAVLVLGNEDKGLRPGVAKRCGRMLRIPLARKFDSLNVAQAGAILLGLAAMRRQG